jgi:hypothetical protein
MYLLASDEKLLVDIMLKENNLELLSGPSVLGFTYVKLITF